MNIVICIFDCYLHMMFLKNVLRNLSVRSEKNSFSTNLSLASSFKKDQSRTRTTDRCLNAVNGRKRN